ncbi:MAG: PIN domain-containing protein [Ignavibacteria bacterium]|nr:PIN domain-containing protein [Ignavibacteria bacterium]
MLQNALIDSGPLIALFDKSDSYHKKILDFLKNFKGNLITSISVVMEVTHMLDFNVNAQIDFLKWIDSGGLKIFKLEEKHFEEIIKLFEKYSDIPMDLADASLLIASDELNIKNIISIDSDFNIFKTLRKKYLKNLFI